MLPLRMQKEIYVGTRIIFFTFVNLIKLPLYINLSMTNLVTFKQSVFLFPLAFLGILIGYRLIKLIDEKFGLEILPANKNVFVIGHPKSLKINNKNCYIQQK